MNDIMQYVFNYSSNIICMWPGDELIDGLI